MSIRLRPVLAVAVCAALAVGTGIAAAAPAPVCNLVKDAAGDAEILTAQKGLDIVSADISSNAKTVTAVIRLSGPPAGANPEAAGGSQYYFEFAPLGAPAPQYLLAEIPFVGEPVFSTGQITTTAASRSFENDDVPVTGSIKGNELTISAPLSAFAERTKMKPGTKFAALQVETFALVGLFLVGVDEATGKSYVAGTPSCVKPGK